MRHSAGDTPLQVVPALRGDDGVDGTTLRFLLEQNLTLKKKQEEKEKEMKEKKVRQVKFEQLQARRRVVIRELDTLLLVPFVRRSDQENDRVDELQKLRDRLNREFDLLSAPSKKKKKKRKKKLPRGRARRRQRQRPLSGALIVDSGSGTCKAGLFFLALCSLWLQTGPDARHHGRYDQEGWFLSVAPRIWQSLVRCFLWFKCSSWTRCARTSLSNNRCRPLSDIPVLAQRQFPMVQLFMLIVQFSDKVVEVPVRCSTTGAAVPQLQFFFGR